MARRQCPMAVILSVCLLNFAQIQPDLVCSSDRFHLPSVCLSPSSLQTAWLTMPFRMCSAGRNERRNILHYVGPLNCFNAAGSMVGGKASLTHLKHLTLRFAINHSPTPCQDLQAAGFYISPFPPFSSSLRIAVPGCLPIE
jgi:hypothetical protein